MQFAKLIFRIAGIWGFLILLPMYFLLDNMGQQNPPPVTHSEFYYGFIGLALAWQIAFFLIASDPVRFRPIMLAAIPEKFIFVVTVLILARHQAISSGQWVGVAADFLLGIVFVIAYFRTPRSA